MYFIHQLKNHLDILILIYAATIYMGYFCLTALAAFALNNYLKQQRFVDYEILIASPLIPAISVIAPAYNESRTLVDNIKALLALHYNNFEVIVINDGSTDDSMQIIESYYELESIPIDGFKTLPCKQIKAIYKSRNKAFHHLTVVDKYNGGKADAMNAGLNLVKNNYFVAVDVDCILEPDALLKLIKPVLMAKDKKVIATGGAIRVANSCRTEEGCIVEINFPTNFWARFQSLEYIRAFLIGRMSWSQLNGLMLVSGALGLFDKEIVVNCGGYLTSTVGEDMELIMRMRCYMCELKVPHKVVYIPDPLCWTEVPGSLKYLCRQRNRWTRGSIDSLLLHKKVLMNPKYGILGLLTYPFCLLFEWLAPWAEFLGLLYFLFLSALGEVNWPMFILLISFVYLFSVGISFLGILFEELSFKKCGNSKDLMNIYLTALLEPIVFHPCSIFWALKGNLSYFKGEKKWGNMERSGFKRI